MKNFTDDTVVAVASFLSPHDMLSLALTCKRFGAKSGTTATKQPDRGERSRDVRQKTETVSLMEVAAHTVLQTKWTDEEKKALPRRVARPLYGEWQSYKDIMEERREMITKIVQILRQTKPNAPQEWLNKLPPMAKRLEESLYRSAPSFGAYNDISTLRQRLKQLAMNIRMKTERLQQAAKQPGGQAAQHALPRRQDESWISLYHEFLVVFRLPLQFDKLVGDEIHYVEGSDKTKVCTGETMGATAICNNIMRAGKHYVSFQVNDDNSSGISCGIMRPTTNDITSLESCNPVSDDLSSFSLKKYDMLHGDNNINCCLLNTAMGLGFFRKRWKLDILELAASMNADDGDDVQRTMAEIQNNMNHFDWEGMEETQDASFKVGMVLDLDEGTLDVYKNDRRLGTMMSGLVGEYCWAITMYSNEEVSVSIGR